MWSSSVCVLAIALPLCWSLTCVNKQTAIAGGYKSTTNQGGASCTANKWCMKITGESTANGETSTGINSKCSDGDSDDRTCDTQAANKCWTLNGATSKSEICCCNQDNCNDTPNKPGVEQLSSSVSAGGAPSIVAGPPGLGGSNSSAPLTPSRPSAGNATPVDVGRVWTPPANASASGSPSADANRTGPAKPPMAGSNSTIAEPEPASNATVKATTKAPEGPPSASDKPANKPKAEPTTGNNAPTSLATCMALVASLAIGWMLV